MKLLIITQKVDKNDTTLGFFHEWIKVFAAKAEKVVVIALEVREYELPTNVEVLSLGKERGATRGQILMRLYAHIVSRTPEYDHVFVHMNQIYLIVAGWFWRLLGKRVAFWYTHRQVSPGLRFAALFPHYIFTAAKESFNIPSPKVHVVGHGIEVSRFRNPDARTTSATCRIVSVGRITRIKNLGTLVEAAHILAEKKVNFKVRIIGETATEADIEYRREIEELVKKHELEDFVEFAGSIPNKDIASEYWNADINVNLAPTGGIDKVVLEGIAAGAVPLVSNQAFKELFGEHADLLIFGFRDADDLATKITAMPSRTPEVRAYLSSKIGYYSIESLIDRILTIFK